jgi:hypothetical protein
MQLYHAEILYVWDTAEGTPLKGPEKNYYCYFSIDLETTTNAIIRKIGINIKKEKTKLSLYS